MGSWDHIDWELNDQIQDLLDEGILVEGTPAHGVAQQVIHQGYDSLSENQKYVWDNHVCKPLGMRQNVLAARRIIDSNPD